MKLLFLTHIALALCILTFGTDATSVAGQPKGKGRVVQKAKKPGRPKSAVKRRVRRASRRLPPVDTTAVRASVVDTCAFDSLTELQRRFLAEVNQWGSVRYHRGGTTKLGVDCSGFTSRIYQDAVSVALPRTSGEQAKIGEKIDRDELSFGDLLFFFSKSKRKRINHVGIYLADGRFVHSSRSHGVRIDSLGESYYARHFATARRVMTEPDPESDSEAGPGAESALDSLSGSR